LDNDLHEKLKDNKHKTILRIFIIVIGIAVVFAISINSNKREQIKTNTTSTKPIEKGYNPTTEESKVLEKAYKNFTGNDYTIFNDLNKKYDSMSDDQKKNIRINMERLKKEKDDYLEESKTQSEQNKQLYSDLTQEIENSFPDMKVDLISGVDKQKTIFITMRLLYNIDATERKCAELAVMKETRMKEVGISKIIIDVKDKNGDLHGSLFSELKDGKFIPTLDTIQ